MSYKLPKTLKICNISVAVTEGEIETTDDNLLQVGEYDSMTQEIRIDPRLKDDSKAQILWHELIHATLDCLGYCNLTMDENLVQGLAISLMGTIGPIKA